MDVVLFTVDFPNFALVVRGHLAYSGEDRLSLFQSEHRMPKFRTQNNVDSQVVNTVACTVKVKISDTLAHRLQSLSSTAIPIVKRMLNERQNSSSKYYPELPCVLSKSLIAKYQNNGKCRDVTNLVLPICGDKERQIKLTAEGVRIPALFGKEILPVIFPRPVYGDEKGRRNVSAEFFHRSGEWFGTFTYRTIPAPEFQPTGMIGIDRNSVGHVATLSDPTNGKVLHLGFNPAATKVCWRRRKANLQRKEKQLAVPHQAQTVTKNKARKSHRIQSNRGLRRYPSSRHCGRGSGRSQVEKFQDRSYTERSQWSFYQLLQFIIYKAALRGVR